MFQLTSISQVDRLGAASGSLARLRAIQDIDPISGAGDAGATSGALIVDGSIERSGGVTAESSDLLAGIHLWELTKESRGLRAQQP